MWMGSPTHLRQLSCSVPDALTCGGPTHDKPRLLAAIWLRTSLYHRSSSLTIAETKSKEYVQVEADLGSIRFEVRFEENEYVEKCIFSFGQDYCCYIF